MGVLKSGYKEKEQLSEMRLEIELTYYDSLWAISSPSNRASHILTAIAVTGDRLYNKHAREIDIWEGRAKPAGLDSLESSFWWLHFKAGMEQDQSGRD